MSEHSPQFDFSLYPHIGGYTVRACEVGTDLRITPLALGNLMQDAADEHAHKLKVGIQDLIERKLAWMISGLTLRIHRHAGMHERIRIATWPAGFNRYFAYRRFHVFDAQDQLIAETGTSWIVYDFGNGVIANMPEDIRALKLPQGLDCSPTCQAKVPELKEWRQETLFPVRRSDLDFNRHVNSAVYCQWSAETTPAEIMEEHQLSLLEIRYKAECAYGEIVRSHSRELAPEDKGPALSEPGERRFLHKLSRSTDGKESARTVTCWIPRV